MIHHTDCGSRLLEDAELSLGFAERSGSDEATLAQLPATAPAKTVQADVEKILSAPISPRITISGLVYHTDEGLLESVTKPTHPGS